LNVATGRHVWCASAAKNLKFSRSKITGGARWRQAARGGARWRRGTVKLKKNGFAVLPAVLSASTAGNLEAPFLQGRSIISLIYILVIFISCRERPWWPPILRGGPPQRSAIFL